MIENQGVSRRNFLLTSSAFAAAFAAGPRAVLAQATKMPVRIVSTRGSENTTLQQLLATRQDLESFDLAPSMVWVNSPGGTLEALESDAGDICMISGFNGLLPAIEAGANVKVVGAAMRLPALAVYASEGISGIRDLAGKRIGIGPEKGLLHATMVGLLKKHGVAASSVKFEVIGSNAQVFEAVAQRKVDAGPSDVANMARASRANVRALADGLMWKELPLYPYQLVYASTKAIADRRETLVRTLAAYARMYRFLSTPASWSQYSAARMAATNEKDADEGRPAWTFVQENKPYALDIAVSPEQVAFIQNLHVEIGSQKTVLPFDRIADMSLARDALTKLT